MDIEIKKPPEIELIKSGALKKPNNYTEINYTDQIINPYFKTETEPEILNTDTQLNSGILFEQANDKKAFYYNKEET